MIIIERDDGGVSIMGLLRDVDIDRQVARWQETHPARAVRWRLADAATLPIDRTYRSAWRHDLSVDMTRARGIQRERIRAARAAALERLDAEWLRATGQGKAAEAQAIEAQRQALRDAPADPRIDAAQTPEQLKATWPTGL